MRISKLVLEAADMSINEFLASKEDDPLWYCNKQIAYCYQMKYDIIQTITFDVTYDCYDIKYDFVFPTPEALTMFLLKFPSDDYNVE